MTGFLLLAEIDESIAKIAESIADAEISGSKIMLLLTVFVLAIFIGFEIITKIPPTLHTPLMSGSNAISGITVIGAVLVAGESSHWFANLLGFLAVILATMNAVGGFMVTHRMLDMFKRKN